MSVCSVYLHQEHQEDNYEKTVEEYDTQSDPPNLVTFFTGLICISVLLVWIIELLVLLVLLGSLRNLCILLVLLIVFIGLIWLILGLCD